MGLNFTASRFGVESTAAPADANGVIGLAHYVELINGRFAVYDKFTGASVASRALLQFFTDSGITPNGTPFDPRVIFDAASGRWFACAVDNARAPNNFLFAVSSSPDPTQRWQAFLIDADADNREWADFPTLGVNRDVVVLSALMLPLVAGGPSSTTFVVLPKADLLLPVPGIARATIYQNRPFPDTGFVCQPAVDLTNSPMPLPVLSAINTASGLLKRSGIGGTALAPTLVVADGLVAVDPAQEPPDARQPPIGGPQKAPLDTFDSRFSASVVLRGGSLWAVQNISDGGNPFIRWFQLNPATGDVLQ